MKTIGGFEVTEFKQLENPIDKFPLKPNVFSGIVDDPKLGKKLTFWDEDGKCNNPLRKDCYIKIG